MGWGLGGVPSRLGFCYSRAPPGPGGRCPSGGQGVVSQAGAWACRASEASWAQAGPRHRARRRRSSSSLRCRLPLPSDNERKAASTSQLPWQPRPPGSCCQCRERGLFHTRGWWGKPGMPGSWGRDLRGATWGQGPEAGGQGGPPAGTGKAPRPRMRAFHRGSGIWWQQPGARGPGPGVRSWRAEAGHRGLKPDASPLRRAPSSSGFLVTDTTFMTRRFPPWRIRATTCLCPTFTTFTPFTWDREAGGRVVLGCPPQALGSAPHLAAQVRMSLTSMRKSPVRSPALQATPSTSTDSRYCSAGKAGVGVNSSMGVSAAGGRGRGS